MLILSKRLYWSYYHLAVFALQANFVVMVTSKPFDYISQRAIRLTIDHSPQPIPISSLSAVYGQNVPGSELLRSVNELDLLLQVATLKPHISLVKSCA
jgi:hypothetical protein